MLFNSYTFIFAFLPVALAGYSLIARLGEGKWATLWLVCCSLFFYSWWNPSFLPVLACSIVGNFIVSSLLRKKEIPSYRGDKKKFILVFGIVANLAALGYFKYAGFFSQIAFAPDGFAAQFQGIVLPLAISFFTFQQITYLVDTYKGEATASDFLNYCLFVTFFPQLIAGPIVHHKEMMPQFAKLHENRDLIVNLSFGITIFSIGLLKKVLLADSLALHATPVFGLVESGTSVDLLTAWKGALAYTLQIYFDFSGYSDMAIGLARMFGIHLPLNFNSPYKSFSIIEFWRRWHMTLSRFLRDYLYIPMGGSRKGSGRRYFNLLATMLIGGLWHGAGWTFIFWGALHGVYLTVNHGWHTVTRHLKIEGLPNNKAWKVFSYVLTMLAVVIGWVFFRAESFETALSLLSSMSGQNGIVMPAALENIFGWTTNVLPITFAFGGGADFVSAWLLILLSFLIALTLPNTQEIVQDSIFLAKSPDNQQDYAISNLGIASKIRWRASSRWAAVVGVIFGLSIMSLNSVSEFLYFQF